MSHRVPAIVSKRPAITGTSKQDRGMRLMTGPVAHDSPTLHNLAGPLRQMLHKKLQNTAAVLHRPSGSRTHML